jgi:hypothetical protein
LVIKLDNDMLVEGRLGKADELVAVRAGLFETVPQMLHVAAVRGLINVHAEHCQDVVSTTLFPP